MSPERLPFGRASESASYNWSSGDECPLLLALLMHRFKAANEGHCPRDDVVSRTTRLDGLAGSIRSELMPTFNARWTLPGIHTYTTPTLMEDSSNPFVQWFYSGRRPILIPWTVRICLTGGNVKRPASSFVSLNSSHIARRTICLTRRSFNVQVKPRFVLHP
jgi:hypothetical protein